MSGSYYNPGYQQQELAGQGVYGQGYPDNHQQQHGYLDTSPQQNYPHYQGSTPPPPRSASGSPYPQPPHESGYGYQHQAVGYEHYNASHQPKTGTAHEYYNTHDSNQIIPRIEHHDVPDNDKSADEEATGERGLGGSLLGGAAGLFAGHKANHGLLGTIGGALVGSLVENQIKKYSHGHGSSSEHGGGGGGGGGGGSSDYGYGSSDGGSTSHHHRHKHHRHHENRHHRHSSRSSHHSHHSHSRNRSSSSIGSRGGSDEYERESGRYRLRHEDY